MLVECCNNIYGSAAAAVSYHTIVISSLTQNLQKFESQNWKERESLVNLHDVFAYENLYFSTTNCLIGERYYVNCQVVGKM
jgi:hypothetical protein